MSAEHISHRIAEVTDGNDREALRVLLSALLDAVQTIATKLDNDAAVAEADYAQTVDGIIRK